MSRTQTPRYLVLNYKLQITYYKFPHVWIQFAETDVASQAAVRDAAEKDGTDRGRGLGRRWHGHRQNGWPQAAPQHRDRSGSGEGRRCRDAAGPSHGRTERSQPQGESGDAIKRRGNARRTRRDFVIW